MKCATSENHAKNCSEHTSAGNDGGVAATGARIGGDKSDTVGERWRGL